MRSRSSGGSYSRKTERSFMSLAFAGSGTISKTGS